MVKYFIDSENHALLNGPFGTLVIGINCSPSSSVRVSGGSRTMHMLDKTTNPSFRPSDRPSLSKPSPACLLHQEVIHSDP